MSRRHFVVLSAAALFLAACSQNRAKGPRSPVESAAVEVPAEGEPTTRGKSSILTHDLEAIYFDYDQASLRPEAQAALKRNADWIRGKEFEFVVEGHCDARGTTGYNLALGQRRASAVRDYYKSLGVKASRIATISYGEERLLCSEDSDSCHSRNRRGVTGILEKGISSQPKK